MRGKDWRVRLTLNIGALRLWKEIWMSLYGYLGAIKDIYELRSGMKAVLQFWKIGLAIGDYP